MFELIGIQPQALLGQILLGLINGSFYAMLSLGLALIFGMLNVINFAHGAQYMLGAFFSWMLLHYLGIGYWWALLLAPLGVAAVGYLIEVLLLRRIAHLDHLYGLLITFGVALVLQSALQGYYGAAGAPYAAPPALQGGFNLGFMFLPKYRLWVVVFSLVVCLAVWLIIERTRLGSWLRAGTENAMLVRTFGINIGRLQTLTYVFGAGLAGLAGVLAAPIMQVRPTMGADMIIIVFAVVVIGGMGSVLGSILTGFLLGFVQGVSIFIYPEASNMTIYVIMMVVLILKPAGLFGKTVPVAHREAADTATRPSSTRTDLTIFAVMAACLAIAPSFVYPFFLMQAMCFALFACSFNLLLGYVGLLSFGHAMFFGGAAYVSAHAALVWGLPTELAILAGVAAGALLGLLSGAIAIRRQGIYFAMITLALAQLVYFLALQAPFTHGEDGIQSVPRTNLLGLLPLSDPMTMYWFVMAVFLIGFLIVYRTVNSPFGEVLRAVRDNEPRAVSLGYEADRYKLAAFVLAAAIAGLAGGTKALVTEAATLTDVHWTMSGEVVLMTLVGGVGTLYGPVIGAFLIILMQNFLAPYGQLSTLAQGALFILCVLAFRRGLVGEFLALYHRSSQRTTKSGATRATDGKLPLSKTAATKA